MKKFLAPALGLFAAGFFLIDPVLAQSTLIDVNDRPNALGSDAFGGSLRQAIKTVIDFFLFFLGLIATAFVIYGGFLYVTSQGEDQKVETAKKIITFSAIGIIIILISYAVVNTVLGGVQSGQKTL